MLSRLHPLGSRAAAALGRWGTPAQAAESSTLRALCTGAAATQHSSDSRSPLAAGAAAAAAAVAAVAVAAAWPAQADCSSSSPTAAAAASPQQQSQQGWAAWAASWLPWRLHLWGGVSQRPSPAAQQYLHAIAADAHLAVVLAYALPYLSLSFGFAPAAADMDAAAALVQPHLQHLRPWEVAVLLWGAARLGYAPAPPLLRQLQERVAAVLAAPPGSPEAFTVQEACMAAWALSALQAQTPQLWSATMAFAAACPPDSWDEVALVHLFQAAMFADRDSVTALGPGADGTAAQVPRMRSAADEARATLAAGGCPLALAQRCEQGYRASSQQPGGDGPLIVELSMLRLLVSIYQELGDSYAQLFHDLRLADLQQAKQLLADPFLLAKFKAGVAEKRARSNAFTRTLGDVSRTLRALGLHHTVQAPVEDALVHVDVALPDYKIAFFLETPAAAPLPPSSSGSRGAAPAAPLASLDEEGAKLSGFVQNETPGTKAAKLRLLQSRGWVVLPLNWPPEVRGEAEKRRLLLEQLDRAGQEQLMRGRVSSMMHGAMRLAEESKLGGGRYGDRGSAGQYITRQH